MFFHCCCKIATRILPRSHFRQGLRKNKHLIGLKKISPVLQVGAEQTLLQYFTGDFPILFLTLLCIHVFNLKRMRLWFSKFAGMDIYNSLRNTKLLEFSESWIGWDGMD